VTTVEDEKRPGLAHRAGRYGQKELSQYFFFNITRCQIFFSFKFKG